MNWRVNLPDLNTFEEVAHKYKYTKPVVSCKHRLEWDVRPIGPRSRAYERVIKVNRNKYVITNELRGDYDDGDIGVIKHAPITWTRRDGVERIQIQNTRYPYADTLRYTLLENILPQGLYFFCQNGKQYVQNNELDCTVSPAVRPDPLLVPKVRAYRHLGLNKFQSPQALALTFERHNGRGESLSRWVNVGNTYSIEAERVTVDRHAKAKMKNGIDSFWAWLLDVYDFLPVCTGSSYDPDSYKYVRRINQEVQKYTEETYAHIPRVSEGHYYVTKELLEDVLQDEKHPYRTHVAVIFMSYATQPLRSVEDVRALRKKYNAFINMCALLKKVTSEEKLVIYKGNKNG